MSTRPIIVGTNYYFRKKGIKPDIVDTIVDELNKDKKAKVHEGLKGSDGYDWQCETFF